MFVFLYVLHFVCKKKKKNNKERESWIFRASPANGLHHLENVNMPVDQDHTQVFKSLFEKIKT